MQTNRPNLEEQLIVKRREVQIKARQATALRQLMASVTKENMDALERVSTALAGLWKLTASICGAVAIVHSQAEISLPDWSPTLSLGDVESLLQDLAAVMVHIQYGVDTKSRAAADLVSHTGDHSVFTGKIGSVQEPITLSGRWRPRGKPRGAQVAS